jgi:hypothetical protein
MIAIYGSEIAGKTLAGNQLPEETTMKIALIAPLSLVLMAAVPQAAIHAQPYQGPSITIPLPGYAPEHREGVRDDHERRCAELGDRERDLHERLERASFSPDRDRLDHELRETRERLRDECHH